MDLATHPRQYEPLWPDLHRRRPESLCYLAAAHLAGAPLESPGYASSAAAFLVSGPSQIQTQTLRRQSVQGRNNACRNCLLHVSMHDWAKDYHAGSDWRINRACEIPFPRTPLDLVDPPQLQPTRVCWSPLLSASRKMRQDA